MKSKATATNVQFKLDPIDSQSLQQKITEELGLTSLATFYKFLTKNFLANNISIDIKPKRVWHTTEKFEKTLEAAENQPPVTIKDVDQWAESL